jgi:hypothetical protein
VLKHSHFWRSIAAILLGLTVAACDDTGTPVNPGGVLPQIVSISPSPIVASPASQVINVSGNQFVAGLRLRVMAPDGLVVSVQGQDIQAVEPTSFRATVVLNQTGTHSFVVENDNGARSDVFNAVVQANAAALPAITSATPSSLPPSASMTIVTLQGSNFNPGLIVNVIDPGGSAVVLGPASISVQTATRVEFSYVFSSSGLYTVAVRNSNGDTSNPVSITVN